MSRAFSSNRTLPPPSVDALEAGKAPPADAGGGRSILSSRRSPAVAAAISFAVGITADHFVSLPLIVWLLCGAVMAGAWGICLICRREYVAAVLLAVLAVCVGGARHHQICSTQAEDDVSLLATDEPKLVHLTGTLANEPLIRWVEKEPWRSAWVRSDNSAAILRCQSMQTVEGTVPLSGSAQLRVTGHLLHVGAGDKVEIHGWLTRPSPPRNPGEFDARVALLREGTVCIVRADHPDAVVRLTEGTRNGPSGWIARWRNEIGYLFTRHLGPRTEPLASSLILGDRGGLTREVRDAFAESGMMHVLAISGQNVGILAALFLIVCRMLHLSGGATAVVIATVSVGYAFLTLGEPPIVRATVMVLILCLGRPWYREANLTNLLAIAALFLLVWSPQDLFDVGAQLSFMAVMAMGWFASTGLIRRWFGTKATLGDEDHRSANLPARLSHAARTVWHALLAGYGLTVAIWIFTLPLVAARFHLVSPIGLVINVLFAPVVVAVLWLGYAFALCGLVAPPLGELLGPAFRAGLEGFLSLIDTAAQTPLAWLHVPAIPEWWLVGYYALLVFVVGFQGQRRLVQQGVAALLLWTVGGLAYGLIPESQSDLKVTFLSVGHGCSVLVEMPNGRTLLYDAGAIHDADFAEHVVENALWQAGKRSIDALVVSHADVDHFNAVPGLLNHVPIGTMFFSRSFADLRKGLVSRLCDSAADHGVPMRLIQRGDRLLLDPSVAIEILHPVAEVSTSGVNSKSDNANSVVLQIEFAGRTILLTGDLAENGLQSLLTTVPCKSDVLLSPHHGSPASNPPDLARWARPELVVVSNTRASTVPILGERYAPVGKVLSTHDCGAIVVTITQRGDLNYTTTVPRPQDISTVQTAESR